MTEDEEGRCEDDEGSGVAALPLVQAGGDEEPDLQKNDRRRKEEAGVERHLHVEEERRRELRVGELVAGRQHLDQRLLQLSVDLFGPVPADAKRDDDRDSRDHQPLPELVQMVEERHLWELGFRLFDLSGRGSADVGCHQAVRFSWSAPGAPPAV
jgi:hypothetical protein